MLGLAIATLNGRGFAGPNIFVSLSRVHPGCTRSTLGSDQHRLPRTPLGRSSLLAPTQTAHAIQDVQPARSRAQIGDWPASSASPRLGAVRTSTLLAAYPPESQGPPPAPRRTTLRFAGPGPSPASREPPAPSR